MEECELCGRSTEIVHVIDIEGAEMRVCASCANGKRLLYKEDKRAAHKSSVDLQVKSQRVEKGDMFELVPDYGTVIHNARERLKIPIKVLAEMINEKEHFLARVESQKTVPPDALVGKLERALNVKLRESG